MFQRVEDLFCQTVRDARYFSNFLDAGLLQPLQPTHILQQHLATLRPHSLDSLKRAGALHFRPFFTMSGNRMIVRFIADVLDYVQSGRIRRQAKPLAFRFKE